MANTTPNRGPGETAKADTVFRIAHYALLAGLCQLIPLPFADDFAERQVRRRMVESILARRNRSLDADDLKPLWAGARRDGLLARAGSGAKALLFKPGKKLFRTVFFLFTARQALMEAGEALVMGHTLDRLLAAGRLPDGASAEALGAESKRIALAVERAWAGSDRRGLMALMRHSARRLRDRGNKKGVGPPSPLAVGDAKDLEESLDPDERQRLDEAASELGSQLESEQGRSWLATFDAAVDARLSAAR